MTALPEDLQRRVSEALDADGDDLSALLAEHPEASLYAQDLEAIDEALLGLGGRGGTPDWEAMAASIEARLDADETLDDIGDVTAAPEFELDEAPVAANLESSPYVASADPPSPATSAGPSESGQVVSLDAARRRRQRTFALVGGLAAAAAVGLGITAGLSMNADEPAMEAAAVAMEEPAPIAMADEAPQPPAVH